MTQGWKRLGGGTLVALAVMLVWSAQALASVAFLNVDNTNPSCNDTTGSPAFCHIQAAVNHASNGDGITVSASTYHELVTVNKSVTIDGAKHGVNANDPSRGSGRERRSRFASPSLRRWAVSPLSRDGLVVELGEIGVAQDVRQDDFVPHPRQQPGGPPFPAAGVGAVTDEALVGQYRADVPVELHSLCRERAEDNY